MGVGAAAAAILTGPLGRPTHKHGRAYCGACKGKGFCLDREPGSRSARKCQRCRGKGFTSVGGTKR